MADETGAPDEEVDLFGLSPPDLTSPLSPKPPAGPPSRPAPRPAAAPAAVTQVMAAARPAAPARPAITPVSSAAAPASSAAAPVAVTADDPPPASAVPVHVIAEPLEELLQQVTEQTLRMNHFDAGLKEMAKAVLDMGEATQAGIVEVRGLVAQVARPGGVGQSDHWQDHVSERLDSLEAGAARARTRQLGLLAIAVVELVLLLLVVAAQVGWVSFRKKSEEFSFAPPPAPAATTAPAAPAATAAPALPPSPPPDLSPVKRPGNPRRAKH